MTTLEELQTDLKVYLDDQYKDAGSEGYQLLRRCENAIADAIEAEQSRPDCDCCDALGDSWAEGRAEGLADGIEQAKDALQHAMHLCRTKIEKWADIAMDRYVNRQISSREIADEFVEQLDECEELFMRESNKP